MTTAPFIVTRHGRTVGQVLSATRYPALSGGIVILDVHDDEAFEAVANDVLAENPDLRVLRRSD